MGDDVLGALEALAAHVEMVHLKDVEQNAGDRVAGPRSVSFGSGAIPLTAILNLLVSRRFGGLVCVELGQLGPGDDEHALVSQCVSWLREQGYADRGS